MPPAFWRWRFLPLTAMFVASLLFAADFPAYARGGGAVHVRGYYKKNGTYVQPHYRSSPDGNFWNNWSTTGNVNPYTGQPGTKTTPPTGGGDHGTVPPHPIGSVSPPQEGDLTNGAAPGGDGTELNVTQGVGRSYFTVGSTKDEVLAAQGTPNSFSATTWTYGCCSQVYFAGGVVTSWHNSGFADLRARMMTSEPTSRTPGYFTVGSTKDEVLAVQGTPNSFSATTWTYGCCSQVYFAGGVVTSWHNSGFAELRVRLQSSLAK